jgi:replicative DNA helicase
MTTALSRMHAVTLTVDETGGLSVAQILARARRAMRKEGKLDLVVVDYLGLIKPANSGTTNNRNDEVTQISAGLKAMAKDLHCPVIALSQLSRKVVERTDKRPMMSDLRDSGSLEQDADVILMLYRDEYYSPNSSWRGLAECIVTKHRNGRTGPVNLVFQGEYCRFRDASHEAVAAAMQAASDAKPVKRSRGFDR